MTFYYYYLKFSIFTHPIDSLIKIDIMVMPKPLPDTKMISTSSRFRLKYCPTISAAGSLDIPTPKPRIE